MPLKIKFIKDDEEGILPYCEEEDAEKFYFQQILTARFSWGSNKYGAVEEIKCIGADSKSRTEQTDYAWQTDFLGYSRRKQTCKDYNG
jgi:hypothetical protein